MSGVFDVNQDIGYGTLGMFHTTRNAFTDMCIYTADPKSTMEGSGALRLQV